MRINDPDFWVELTKSETVDLPNLNEAQPEDIDPETSLEDVVADDSNLAIPTLIGVMTGGELPDYVGIRDGGGLVSIAEAENVDLQLESAEANLNLKANPENKPKELETKPNEELEGRGKRSKIANKQYSAFWRHNDADDWRDDKLLPNGHEMSHH
jgi:hypothetical protein